MAIAGLCAVLVLAPAAASAASAAPAGQSGWMGRIAGILSGQPGAGPVTQREADQGVREALTIAAAAAADRLGAPGGFLDSPRVRIPLPGALARAQARLQPFGMSAPLDELEQELNRAAEATMPEAKRLALEAVKSLTFGDALAIVRGGDQAATTFLRSRTEAALAAKLRPQMAAALEKSGAFAALDRVRANGLVQAFAGDVRKDVTDFAVQKAVDGFFATLAEEEKAIRADPARRTSAIMKRVFALSPSS
ncbi:MAG: DUF4197 family protein [Alphaproteobacteria bacterium]|nr:DUF4197 family protein [Alphaproteobacteria bacterium]